MRLTAAELAETDLVYYVRPGEKNEELRFSLRSVENIPHRHVWMVGGPKWVKNVRRLEGNLRRGASPWRHGYDNVRIIAECDDPEMSEKVVVMNDDFLVLQPVEELPLWCRNYNLPRQVEITSNKWADSLQLTNLYLQHQAVAWEPRSYELHVPFPMDRGAMAAIMGAVDEGDGWDPPLQWRTLYGNIEDDSGGKYRRGDVKIKSNTAKGILDAKDFLSTSDRDMKKPRVRTFVRRRFHRSSEHE